MYRYIIPPVYILVYVILWILLLNDFRLSHSPLLIIVATVFLVSGAAIGLAGAFMKDSLLKFLLHAIHNLFLAILIYFLIIYVGLRIVMALVHLYQGDAVLKEQRLILIGFCILLAIATSVYGFFHARKIQVTHYQVTSSAPHFVNQSLRIGFVADLHLGVNTSLSVIEDMVAKMNAQKPDIILLGGDYFNSSYNALDEAESYAKALKKLEAPLGVYGVYGNHDAIEDLLCGFPMTPLKQAMRTKDVDDFMKAAEVTMLNDEAIRFGQYGVTLVGRQSESKTGDGDTPRATLEDVLDDEDLEDAIIVLQHEPVELKALNEAGVSLSLSGHTHDGQFFPLNIPGRIVSELSYGMKTYKESLTAITTSGAGFYGPPIRVGTKSEIVIIDFTSAVTSFNNC